MFRDRFDAAEPFAYAKAVAEMLARLVLGGAAAVAALWLRDRFLAWASHHPEVYDTNFAELTVAFHFLFGLAAFAMVGRIGAADRYGLSLVSSGVGTLVTLRLTETLGLVPLMSESPSSAEGLVLWLAALYGASLAVPQHVRAIHRAAISPRVGSPSLALIERHWLTYPCFLLAAAPAFFVWSEKIAGELGLWGLTKILLLGGASFGLGVLIHEAEVRVAQAVADERARGTTRAVLGGGEAARPFVLYLRPFHVTGQLRRENPKHSPTPLAPQHYSQPKTLEFEQEVAEGLGRRIDFVALGRPGEAVGAGRVAVPEESWRETIATLVEAASYVLVLPADTEGTLWELRHLKAEGHLGKTAFLMPASSDEGVAEDWSRTRRALAELALPIPDFDPAGRIFRIDPGGELEVVSESCGARDVGALVAEEVRRPSRFAFRSALRAVRADPLGLARLAVVPVLALLLF